MRNLLRRQVAALGGSLAAVSASMPAFLQQQHNPNADFACGLLFGVGLGVMLLFGRRGRTEESGVLCLFGQNDAR